MPVLEGQDRAAVREITLGSLSDGPEHARAVPLIEALTHEPVAAVVEHYATAGAAPGGPSHLQ